MTTTRAKHQVYLFTCLLSGKSDVNWTWDGFEIYLILLVQSNRMISTFYPMHSCDCFSLVREYSRHSLSSLSHSLFHHNFSLALTRYFISFSFSLGIFLSRTLTLFFVIFQLVKNSCQPTFVHQDATFVGCSCSKRWPRCIVLKQGMSFSHKTP